MEGGNILLVKAKDVKNSHARRQLTRNIFSLTVVQIATYVLPLISVPIISRIIGPDKFGIINFGAAYVTYFTLLISYSFDFTATRRISINPGDTKTRDNVFSEVFYTQLLLFLVSSFVFLIMLWTVPELQANKRVFIFSYLICISTLFTQNWLFQAMQDLSKVALFNLVSKLLFTIAILLVIRKNEDYIWQPFLIGCIQIIVSIWSFMWALRKYNIVLQKFSMKKSLALLVEDRIVFFSLVFVNLYSYTSIVILGFFQSSAQVGYFTSAQRLITIVQSLLTMPISMAFYPYVGKAFGESKEQGMKVVQKLVPIIVVCIGIASLIMVLFGPLAIRLFYGSRFEEAIPVFQLLAITPLLFAINNVLGVQVMLNLKMDKAFFLITAFTAVVSLVFNLLMIKSWGYIGTTINFLLTEMVILICMYVVLRRKGLNPFNIKYFRVGVFLEYLQPLRKILQPFNSSK